MKILANSQQRDAIRKLSSETLLMRYVDRTFTSDLRRGLKRFRPTAEDMFVEVARLLDLWRGSLSSDISDDERYAPFESLLADVEDECRDLSPEADEDCIMVARMVVTMMMALFSTQRDVAVDYVHLSNTLFMQLYMSMGMQRDATLSLTDRFAPHHCEGIGEWTAAYLAGEEWISEDVDKVLQESEPMIVRDVPSTIYNVNIENSYGSVNGTTIQHNTITSGDNNNNPQITQK